MNGALQMPADFLNLKDCARNLDALRGNKKRINILVMGHNGHGKSSLINTFLSLVSGNRFLRRTVMRLAVAQDSGEHVTSRIQCYRIGMLCVQPPFASTSLPI